jgi:hypothetical protein
MVSRPALDVVVIAGEFDDEESKGFASHLKQGQDGGVKQLALRLGERLA